MTLNQHFGKPCWPLLDYSLQSGARHEEDELHMLFHARNVHIWSVCIQYIDIYIKEIPGNTLTGEREGVWRKATNKQGLSGSPYILWRKANNTFWVWLSFTVRCPKGLFHTARPVDEDFWVENGTRNLGKIPETISGLAGVIWDILLVQSCWWMRWPCNRTWEKQEAFWRASHVVSVFTEMTPMLQINPRLTNRIACFFGVESASYNCKWDNQKSPW